MTWLRGKAGTRTGPGNGHVLDRPEPRARFRWLARCGLATILISHVANGAPVLAATPPQAEALIREGLKLRKAGEDAAALERFEEAVRLERSGRALAQVALAEQALGRWVEAEAHLRQALAEQQDPWIGRNRPLLLSSLEEMGKHLGSLDLIGNVAGARVRINGVDRGKLPLDGPLRVPLGTVTVELLAERHFPLVRSVVVTAGNRTRETMLMVPEPVATEAPPPRRDTVASLSDARTEESEPPEDWTWQKKLGTGALVGAGAFLALGGVSSLLQYLNREDAAEQGCYRGDDDPRCSDLVSANEAHGTRALIGFVGAGLLGAAGGTLLWISPAAGERGPSGVALRWGGTF